MLETLTAIVLLALVVEHFIFRHKVLKTFKYFTFQMRQHMLTHEHHSHEHEDLWTALTTLDADKYVDEHTEE